MGLRHLERQKKLLGMPMEKVALARWGDTGAVHRGMELRVNTPEHLCIMGKRKIWVGGNFSALASSISLSCPSITSSFSCTIFSDMVCCLLSNGVSRLHFTRDLQTMSLFVHFSIYETYSTLSSVLEASMGQKARGANSSEPTKESLCS